MGTMVMFRIYTVIDTSELIDVYHTTAVPYIYSIKFYTK